MLGRNQLEEINKDRNKNSTAILLVGAVTTVVVTVAEPHLLNAAVVVAAELVRLTATLIRAILQTE